MSIVVSRHKAAVEFIAKELGGVVVGQDIHIHHWFDPDSGSWSRSNNGGQEQIDVIRVISSANPDDVRGQLVYGNLPLHLAALASEVVAIEFSGDAPRGQEYGLEEMEKAGARLVRYHVSAM